MKTSLAAAASVGLLVATACSGGKSEPAAPAAAPAAAKPVALPLEVQQAPLKDKLQLVVTTKPKATVTIAVEKPWALELRDAVANAQGKVYANVTGPRGKPTLEVTATLDGKTETQKVEANLPNPEELDLRDAHPKDDDKSKERDLVSCRGPLTAEGFPDQTLDRVFVLEHKPPRISLAFTVASGRTLKVGDQVTPFKDGRAETTLDFTPYVANFVVGSDIAVDQKPLEVAFELETGEGTKTAKLGCGIDAAASILSGVAKGPVKFPGEKDRKNEKLSLVLINFGSFKHFGAETKLADLDLVGLMSLQQRQGAMCDYANAAGEKKRVPMLYADLAATIYDRRTGAKVGQKIFRAANAECAETIKASDAAAGGALADEDVLYDWARSLLAKDWEARAKAREEKEEKED